MQDNSSRGIGRVGTLLFVLLLLAGLYLGWQVFPFYYYYLEIKGQMAAQARKASLFTDDQIRRTLWEWVEKLDIPLEEPDDIKINRVADKIIIETSYQEVLYIDLGEDRVWDLWTFDFNPRVEEKF